MGGKMLSAFKRAMVLSLALSAVVAVSDVASAQQEIVIGAIYPLTGPASVTGIKQQNGTQFAVDKVNAKGGIRGRKVRVVYEDSQANPGQGVLAFNRLLDLHKTPAIITAFSNVSLAIAPLATRTKTLVLNGAAQSNKLGDASPYLVNTIPLVQDENSVIAKFALAKLGKTAAIIYENAQAGIDSRDDFKKFFEAGGGKVVAEEAVEAGQTNYRPTMLKIASLKPDFVFVAITTGHEPFVQQASQVPNFPKVLGTTFVRTFCCYASSEGWYFTSIASGNTPTLEQEFMKKYNTPEMDFFAREYYNATDVLLKIVDHVLGKGKELTGENLRAALFEVKSFKSEIADLNFNNTNTAKRTVEVNLQGKGPAPTDFKVVPFDPGS